MQKKKSEWMSTVHIVVNFCRGILCTATLHKKIIANFSLGIII